MRTSVNYLLAMILGGVLVGSILFAANVRAQNDAPGASAGESQSSIVESTLRIDSTFQYQGQLLSSTGTPINGIVPMSFRLYDGANASSALWFQNSSVRVTNGWFTQSLGEIPDTYLDGRNLWLGVKVDQDPEMTPRQPIRPAMFAVNARLLNGRDSSQYLEARRGPIAYGVLNQSGTRQSGWHFRSATRPRDGEYVIQLHDDNDNPINYDAANFTTVVTPIGTSNRDTCSAVIPIASTNSTGDGRLIVFIRDVEDNNFKNCAFHFITIQNR